MLTASIQTGTAGALTQKRNCSFSSLEAHKAMEGQPGSLVFLRHVTKIPL